MKKILLCLLAAAAAVVFAFAAAGDASDPLISLSYLEGTFSDTVDRRVEEKLDASDKKLLQGAHSDSGGTPAAWTERRLKANDRLQASTGSSVLVPAGSVTVSFDGAVIDVTDGAAIPSGAALRTNHRYLVAEDTTASFSVTSKTAVVEYQGTCSIVPSFSVDYNAIAAALKSLHLFKGSFTGYGEGYDLELAPTRLQALIMFIRVLGEEDEALAWRGSTPFQDIARGSQAEQYVGYAYEKGYTNGYSATLFNPGRTIPVYQYMEFMLRALGFSSSSNTDLASTMDNALLNGVITPGELAALSSGPFLRADLTYISYYALEARTAVSGFPLSDMLIEKGVFTLQELRTAQALIPSDRL